MQLLYCAALCSSQEHIYNQIQSKVGKLLLVILHTDLVVTLLRGHNTCKAIVRDLTCMQAGISTDGRTILKLVTKLLQLRLQVRLSDLRELLSK